MNPMDLLRAITTFSSKCPNLTALWDAARDGHASTEIEYSDLPKATAAVKAYKDLGMSAECADMDDGWLVTVNWT